MGKRKYTRTIPLLTPVELIMRRIAIDPASGCWLCDLAVDSGGYSRVAGAGQSHRIMYEHHKGPIPEGKELDHTCHKPSECQGGPTCLHRRCVNPDHVEPATPQENTLRGHGPKRGCAEAAAKKNARTRCKHGHELTGDNMRMYTAPNGVSGRVCVTCAKAAAERWRAVNRRHDENPLPAV